MTYKLTVYTIWYKYSIKPVRNSVSRQQKISKRQQFLQFSTSDVRQIIIASIVIITSTYNENEFLFEYLYKLQQLETIQKTRWTLSFSLRHVAKTSLYV